MSEVVFSHDCIILDACCIINLYASRQFSNILESIPKAVAVATYVRNEEARRIYGGPDDNVMQIEEQIQLQPLIDRGLLMLVSPDSEAENATFVHFATLLDQGEAITGAIAAHRQWSIGSDDRHAISFFAKQAPQLQLVTTLELIKHWVDTMDIPSDVVHTALQNVRARGRYEPHSKHPLCGWWRACMQGK